MHVNDTAGEATTRPARLPLSERFELDRSKINEILLVSAVFLVLTAILTYPWFFNFGTHLIGAPGDNFHYTWKLWWYKHSLIDELSLFNPKKSLFFAPNIFYPTGYNLAMTEMTPANIVPFLPLVVLFGEVITYNIIVLLSFVLSGVGMYLFVKYLTGKGYAGILSGVIFTFAPYHMMHALSHLPLLSIQWLPFMFLFVEKAIREKKARSALWAGVFYALLVLSSWYYAIMLALALGIYLLLRVEKPFKTLRDKRTWLAGLWFAVPSLLLVVPFMIPYLNLSQSGNMTWHLNQIYGAPPWAFFIPAPLHPLLGKFSLPWLQRNICENALSVGIVPTLLAVFAYVKRHDKRVVRASLWLVIIFFVFSLGPFFSDGTTKPFYLKLAGTEEGPKSLITLPGLLLLYLPFMSSIREFTRFGFVVLFFVATLAGIGFTALTASLKADKKMKVLGVVIVLVLFELITVFPCPLSKAEGRPVDIWFSQQKGDFVLFAFPYKSAFTNPQMYYTTVHGKKIAYGRGTFLPPVYREKIPVLETLPSEPALATLRSWKVTHVVVDTKLISKSTAKAVAESPSLFQIKKFDNIIVYGLRR